MDKKINKKSKYIKINIYFLLISILLIYKSLKKYLI